MAGGFKRKSKSDDFVVDDDEDADRPAKRGKAGGSDFQPSTKPKVDDDGNKYWEISKTRRVTISDFKGMAMVNIREYYESDGKSLPGKKVGFTHSWRHERSWKLTGTGD
jgi:Transcriptional Coactivator p15 (PC4)